MYWCNQLGIEPPARAGSRELENLIREYFSKAAAVRTEHGVGFKQTTKKTTSYTVLFQLEAVVEIDAEDEEAAATWIKNNASAGFFNQNFPFDLESYDEDTEILRVVRN